MTTDHIAHARRTEWLALLAASYMVLPGIAQSISPANSTTASDLEQNGPEAAIGIAVSHSEHSNVEKIYPIAALTSDARHYTPESGRSGNILLANASSQLQLQPVDIALISCDPYSGNIQPQEVFNNAKEANVTAIVLYSQRSAGCQISGSVDFSRLYSTTSQANTTDMLNLINSGRANFAQIAPRDALNAISNSNQQNNGSNNGNNQQNALGPSPSTAVAMIILYSITGIITALFLVIIITGAVRAHRHPERYGPRNGVGRPRQSRARGLARAMLDTIPIVKFGDRDADTRSKPADVELARGSHGQVEMVPEQDNISRAGDAVLVSGADARESKDNTQSAAETSEGGIAAAVHGEQSPATDNPGCSICTEEFQVGEDQRVLPCDHRFHPACIDPWLLNVSGTCPLCRIDLRPTTSHTSADELDENGNPVSRDDNGERLAPPLAEQDGSRRASVRRSLMAGLSGLRPERMTREERIAALRRYRDQQAARTDAQDQRTRQALEERGTRVRLRDAFRIRTRRTGENGQAQEESEQSGATQADAPRTR